MTSSAEPKTQKANYTLEFEIMELPKRINTQQGKGWIVNYAHAKKWQGLVAAATLGKRPAKPLERARLTLIRYSSAPPDFDGLVSGFKHVIDALRRLRVLQDDSMKHIGRPDYLWEKALPKKGKIKVRVEEV